MFIKVTTKLNTDNHPYLTITLRKMALKIKPIFIAFLTAMYGPDILSFKPFSVTVKVDT